MSRAVSPARGMTLLECLAGVVVSGVLMAAACGVLLAGSRQARAEAAAREVRLNVRAGAAVLRAELQALAPGDLIEVTDSSLRMRAWRGFGVVCAPPSGSRVVLDDALLSLLRAVDPTRDSARVWVEGDPLVAADDHWSPGSVQASGPGVCSSGARGLALTLGGAAAAALAGVTEGAPLRLYEIQEYRSYRDALGQWWLGVRAPAAGGGWSASSPIAGPLRPRDGLVFRALDSSGTAAPPAAAALVEFTLRVRAENALPSGRRPADSLAALVAAATP